MSSTKFSFDTITDFDDHISKSIPNYHLLNNAIRNISTFFYRKDHSVIDLGCSTGSLLESLDFAGKRIGYDISTNLLPKSHGNISYESQDITTIDTFPVKPSLVYSIFTLQFIDFDKRQKIINTVYDNLCTGGGFIVAEKVHENFGDLEKIMTFSYYDFKQQNFTTSEIMNKEKDLRQIMQTNTSSNNIEMFMKAGFTKTSCFWKFYNFEAWLLVK